jgi:pyrroloquinoline quinone biosynthesis protein D
MASAGRLSPGERVIRVPRPLDTSQPRLAAGCRWADSTGAERMVLFPEGAIRLQGTGREILERCDGERTLQDIVADLQVCYKASEPSKIKEEVLTFLDKLHQKRIVDF